LFNGEYEKQNRLLKQQQEQKTIKMRRIMIIFIQDFIINTLTQQPYGQSERRHRKHRHKNTSNSKPRKEKHTKM